MQLGRFLISVTLISYAATLLHSLQKVMRTARSTYDYLRFENEMRVRNVFQIKN